jgi:hypothetical protein
MSKTKGEQRLALFTLVRYFKLSSEFSNGQTAER